MVNKQFTEFSFTFTDVWCSTTTDWSVHVNLFFHTIDRRHVPSQCMMLAFVQKHRSQRLDFCVYLTSTLCDGVTELWAVLNYLSVGFFSTYAHTVSYIGDNVHVVILLRPSCTSYHNDYAQIALLWFAKIKIHHFPTYLSSLCLHTFAFEAYNHFCKSLVCQYLSVYWMPWTNKQINIELRREKRKRNLVCEGSFFSR